jgi:hypothetical protein
MYGQMLMKLFGFKFHENPLSRFGFVTFGQTEGEANMRIFATFVCERA